MPKQVKLKDFRFAKPIDYRGKLPKNWTCKYIIGEEKLDGFRGLAIVRKGKCKLYTSGGVRVVNGPRIVTALEFIAAQKHKTPGVDFANVVYDGEFYVKNWNDTGSIVKTQSKHPKRTKLSLRIFDMVRLTEWDGKEKPVDVLKRRKVNMALAKQLFSQHNKNIEFMFGKKLAVSDAAIQKFFQTCLKKKVEGAVIKNPDLVYSFKKSNAWLKLKPVYDCDLKVIKFKFGTGRNAKRCGAIICVGKWRGTKVRVQVGGGLTDENRELLLSKHKKNKLIGKIVEMKHEGLTANKSLRFPRFFRIRWDKTEPN